MKRVIVVGLLAACGSVDNKTPDAKVADSPSQVDAPPDAPDGPRCDPTKPFGSLQVLPSVNSTAEDIHPFVTADELQIWFSSNRPGSQGYDIHMASRQSKTADFGDAALIAGVNSAGAETRPTLPANGLDIYIEYRANANTTYKITHASRTSTSLPFGGATEVTELSSTANDVAGYVLPDHSGIYLVSGRSGTALMYKSVRTNGTFQMPALVDGVDLNMAASDYPTVLPDERIIYFLSSRTGSTGTDLWRVARPTTVQAFNAAAKVTEINQTENYFIYSVTADDCIAYLSGPNGANGNDLFVAKKPL